MVSERFGTTWGSEAYTSKQWGHLNDKLGSNELFTCKRCHVVTDRSQFIVHAARNILLRFLV
jgi:hypothetical protein